MGTITVKGKTIEVDEDGFLANLDDWSLDVAKYFAEVEGIEMTDQHWEVVNFLRDCYKQYQIAPMIKILVKEIGKKLGPDKGQHQVPLRALSQRTGQARLQDRRSPETDRLRVRHRCPTDTDACPGALPGMRILVCLRAGNGCKDLRIVLC